MDPLYDNTAHAARGDGDAVDFGRESPLEIFSAVTVYAQFDSDRPGRRPVARTVPGYVGRWVFAYSSLSRLQAAQGNDEVEYSMLRGAELLALIADHAGVWFDRDFPGARLIQLPIPDPPTDTC
jgi:hypothetical protein